MKKTIIIIATLLVSVFVSCTKNETDSADQAITFQVANYLSGTKAGESAFPTNDTFGTYAWTDSANGGAKHQALITEQPVAYVDGVWKTIDSPETKSAKNYYWPKEGTVDFLSYYPAGACWFGIESTNATSISSTQTVSGLANKTNLMYADKAVGCTYANSADGVETLFHHALAKINVNFVASRVDDGNGVKFAINVTSAKFTDINTKGSIEMSYTGTTGKWNAPATWDVDDSSKTDYVMTVGAIDLTPKAVITDCSVLPQPLGDDNKLDIEYTVTTTYPGQPAVSENLVASVLMKDFDVTSWSLNKIITYTVTIDPNGLHPITFLPRVEEWVTTGQSSEIDLNS